MVKPSTTLLIERGELEQYMNDHPESSRRIQDDVRGMAILKGKEVYSIIPFTQQLSLDINYFFAGSWAWRWEEEGH